MPSHAGRGLGWKKDIPKQPGMKADYSARPKLGAATPPKNGSARPYILDIPDQGQLGSCFPAGTPILMADMTERPIEEVGVNNEVLTHDGRKRKVTHVFKRKHDDVLYKVKVQGYAYPLVLTGEHPIFAARNVSKKAKHGKYEPGDLSWVEAKTLAPSDYVLLPADRRVENSKLFMSIDVSCYVEDEVHEHEGRVRVMNGRISHTIPKIITVDEKFARLFGMFLAEGSYGKFDGNPCGINFTFARKEIDYQQFVKSALRDIFGVEAKIDPTEIRPSVTDVSVDNSTLARFFHGLCGEGALGKHLPPIFLRSPLSVRIALLRGWLEGDGTQEKVKIYKPQEVSRAFCTGVTSSEQLHRGLVRLAMSCNTRPSSSIRNQADHQNAPGRDIVFYSKDILVIFPEAKETIDAAGIEFSDKHRRHRDHESGYLCRISSIEVMETDDPIDVYNLEVDEVHTYIAGGIAVHNCVGNGSMQAVRASQVRQGAVNPPLGSRLWTYYMGRALDHDTANDDGTQIRNAFTAISRLGFPPETLWPYSDDSTSPNAPFRTMPSTEAYDGAYDQRATGNTVAYYRLDDGDVTRVQDVQRAIAAGYVVVFGTNVSQNFCQGNLGTGPIAPPIGLQIAGGHCMCLAEYDTSPSGIVTFGVVNSWGSSFGNGGWVEFSSDYVAWSATNDLWICEYAPLFASSGPTGPVAQTVPGLTS
jgi:intein/homing endonuclease